MQAGQQRLIVESGVCVRVLVPVEHRSTYHIRCVHLLSALN